MRTSLLLAALLSLAGGGIAGAQAPAAPDRPATTGTAAHGAVGERLEPGANSFTETQVKERFAKMGFGEVKDLKKDDQGIWHGRATHAGKEVSIGMDFKGNVAAQ
ncbi:PepSY domain-containing protein [Methylobacterium durans]|uniref:PepSY domain-containing protein n=1 Tax=Methylobacterium durans TaxID=2202825 RepID=A0A2U8W7Y5_9HYPH|nr:PepSY domain-containing protein [Methylobacterium durans]AWN41708.1 hypothetical protein DK389_15825 [Methylobacterium durans]